MSRVGRLVAFGCVVVAPFFAASAPSPEAAVSSTCHPQISHSVIPVWARAGFSDSHPRIPYALGRSGRIVAILFGYPRRSPVAPHRNNKILWVSRTPPTTSTALWIRAANGRRSAHRRPNRARRTRRPRPLLCRRTPARMLAPDAQLGASKRQPRPGLQHRKLKHTRPTAGNRPPSRFRSLRTRAVVADDFLGDRFWGHVQGSSGRLKALRGRGAAGRRTSRDAGKAH